MLDFEALQRQMSDFSAHHAGQLADRDLKLRRALKVFEAAGQVDESALNALAQRSSERLVAMPLEHVAGRRDVGPRPAQVTVVATDGSQIYPDRHIEPVCYLLNISRIAFQYGTLEDPVLETIPRLFFRGRDVQLLGADDVEIAGREVVGALRDAFELSELLETAISARVDSRPILAIADGTMIRWMLRGMRNRDLEKKLLKQYIDGLDGFRSQQVPLCSYISMPASREVVNLLAGLGAEVMSEPEDFLDGVSDRQLYDRLLSPGQRSAIFQSRSLVLKEYPAEHQICCFYVKVAATDGHTEIARVEFPFWMNEEPGFVELAHSVIVEESRKGRGYPVVLTEAHEHAVVRGDERAFFYEMIEREMIREGISPEASLKQLSKNLG